MSQVQRGMQELRRALVKRTQRIQRGCCTQDVTFGPADSTSFTVTVNWGTGTLAKVFLASEVFTYSGPRGVRLKRGACRYADEIVSDVLKLRGVL
jgi:hypothetical protein